MNFFTKVKSLMTGTSPAFWDEVRKERGVQEPALYYLTLSCIPAAAVFLYAIYGMSTRSLESVQHFVEAVEGLGLSPYAGILVLIAALFSIMFVGVFIGAGILHLFLRMFGGKGDFAHTYRALAYASTPQLLIGYIPVIGSIASIYAYYLQLRGISELHGFTLMKAFGVVILSSIITVVLAMIVVLGVIGLFTSISGI
jgi:hypothetical protein